MLAPFIMDRLKVFVMLDVLYVGDEVMIRRKVIALKNYHKGYEQACMRIESLLKNNSVEVLRLYLVAAAIQLLKCFNGICDSR